MIGHRNRVASLVTLIVGVIAAATSWAAVGGQGPLSALLGTVLVITFLSAGTIPFVIAGDTRQGRGGVAFVVLGLTYALRLVLALVVLKLTEGHVHGGAVGLTIVACVAAWTGTQLFLGLSKRHQPTLDV